MSDRFLRTGVRLSDPPLGLEPGRPATSHARVAWIAPLYAAYARQDGAWLWPGTNLSAKPLGLEDERPATAAARINWIAPLFAAEAAERVRTSREQRTAAQLRRASAVAVPDTAIWGRASEAADYGPGHQHRSLAGRAPRIEVREQNDVRDPRRQVMRGVVHDPLRRMVLRGEIQARHSVAAQRFRQDVETAGDVFPSRSLVPTGGGGGGGGEPIGTAMAARRVEGAVLAIISPPNELAHLTVFVAIAMERWTIKDLALRLAVRRARIAEVLKQGLEALATHYGIEDDATTRRLAIA